MGNTPQTTSRTNEGIKQRLVELDALRGIAATLVMLFHYTTQFDRIYGHESTPSFALPWGHYGVNLFFMISGFVIFMTLHRIRRPMDFVVSRFSRLFPAFWVAGAITFLLVRWLELPDKTVDLGTALMNLFMIHGLLRIPHVDSVYWTLEIELIFYGMALVLYLTGRIDRVHVLLLALLALRLVWFLAEKFAGIELSWTVAHLLILPYIAWFVCGIMIYRRVTFPSSSPRQDTMVLIAAIGQLAIVEGWNVGLLALGLTAVLWLAAKGRLPLLANPVLAWLGAISYTLYLLHENIGWGVILQLERAGLSADLAILVAITFSLGLATLLTRLVEQPTMYWLREYYRNRTWPLLSWPQVIPLSALGMVTFTSLGYAWHQTHPRQERPSELVTQIYRPTDLVPVTCPFDTAHHPLMILALGQSNAGNHGELIAGSLQTEPTIFYFEGKCYRTTGPAPGATGRGGNIWTALAPKLSQATGQPVIFSVLAVESTRIRDWIDSGKLRQQLVKTLVDQRNHGFLPDLVLWQQGEADARANTTGAKYREHFGRLISLIRSSGVKVPIIVALSTRCRNNGSAPIRNALRAVTEYDLMVRLGPDIDTLSEEMRIEDCHLSLKGLHAAADLWFDIIKPYSLIKREHKLASSESMAYLTDPLR